MASIEFEIQRAVLNGDKPETGFTGAVRSLDSTNLEQGDTWTFPEQYDVYSQKVGTAWVQYIFIEVNGNAKKFFPSTFTKRRTVCEEDGTLTTKRVHTEGTAAELYRTAVSVEEGMNLLKGKTVKVTKMVTIRCLQYGSTQVVNTMIPTIDLVEDKK